MSERFVIVVSAKIALYKYSSFPFHSLKVKYLHRQLVRQFAQSEA